MAGDFSQVIYDLRYIACVCASGGVRPYLVFVSREVLLNVSRKYNTDNDLQNTRLTSFNQIINMLQSLYRFVFFLFYIYFYF